MRNAVTRTFTEITALIENEILPKEGVENQSRDWSGLNLDFPL